jgi:parvulin-like peptidyl-prolyl isomerase
VTKTSYARRFLPFVAVASLALTACGSSNPVASASEAFRLNGTAYSIKDFDSLNDALIAVGQYSTENGTIKREDLAVTLAVLIRYQAYVDFTKANGLTETDEDRNAVVADSESDPNFATYPEALRDTLLKLNVSDRVMERVSAPTAADLEKLYNKMPASAGVLCLSHILVETEDEAREVLKSVNSGTPFAEVAAVKSTEPGADQSGGALKDGDEDCNPLPGLQQSFDADFMVGAIAAKPGVPTGPIKTQFGWHIILSHTFDDVKESAARVLGQNTGALLLAGHLAAANVSVNSKYGVWNGATGRIS